MNAAEAHRTMTMTYVVYDSFLESIKAGITKTEEFVIDHLKIKRNF